MEAAAAALADRAEADAAAGGAGADLDLFVDDPDHGDHAIVLADANEVAGRRPPGPAPMRRGASKKTTLQR